MYYNTILKMRYNWYVHSIARKFSLKLEIVFQNEIDWKTMLQMLETQWDILAENIAFWVLSLRSSFLNLQTG